MVNQRKSMVQLMIERDRMFRNISLTPLFIVHETLANRAFVVNQEEYLMYQRFNAFSNMFKTVNTITTGGEKNE